ncbi:Hypothetical protein, predicted transmembrane protein [Mycoplasma yeatsii 13926]|uniref:Transmembrane protein n=1 Tax=Mycoplasma yeatsii 13926 TaxID=1188240 RepID=S6G8F7_9MOLU|nr:hypothetical protein [Mycoplasma yeatsii]EOA07429.1 Hypothetical protein, predicted transmembrane protein [Mycoplasma yeatsii 13926]
MQELYLQTIYLARNILKTEKLRYFIYKDNQFKNKFLTLINNIFTLEANHDQNIDGETFAKQFAKAFILITNQKEKQRFETFDNKTEEEMFSDIDAIIKSIIKEFKVAKTKLVDQTEKITSSEIQTLSVLSEEIISKWDQKLQQEDKPKQQENIKTQNEQENIEVNQNDQTVQQQDMSEIFKQLNQNMFENLKNKELPVLPIQDPRFYPYNSRPKFMPIFKIILSILSIISTLLAISTLLFLSLSFLDISSDEYAQKLGVSSWTNFMDSNRAQILKRIPLGGLKLIGVQGISLALLHILPAVLICSYTFKSNQNNREKYRMKLMPVILFVVMFGMMLGTLFNFISSKNIEASWKRDLFDQLIQNNKDQFKNNFNSFWELVTKNYGSKINIATILSPVCLSITIFTLIVAVILLVVNPKLDKERIIKANIEHQKAVMAIMSGESYEIDLSLYDTEEIEIKEPNKLQLFIMKLKNKKSNKSKKDE